MQIVIDIPKEFEEHFKTDKFEDSLARVASDIESFGFNLSGRYEQETITMLRKAFKNGTPLDLEGLKSDMKALNCGFPYGLDYLLDCLDKRLGITIIEADKGE